MLLFKRGVSTRESVGCNTSIINDSLSFGKIVLNKLQYK